MISVYVLNVDFLSDENKFNEYLNNCSEYRTKKIEKYAMLKDKKLSLGASILLDYGLNKFGLREIDMKYSLSKNGKLNFLNKPDLFFNISHSENFVMVVFSDSDIGCDIEKITDIDLGISKRYFCNCENEKFIEGKDVKEQKENFFRLWTLKESFLKAIGEGLNKPLNSFEVKFDNNIPYVSDNGLMFSFKEYNIVGYKCAVCFKGKSDINFEMVDL